MALDEPEQEDEIIQVNGIQVAIESNIKDHIDNVILDFDEQQKRIVLKKSETEFC